MNAATQLGWSADQWDEGRADLSNEQVASAEILGYDSTSWNWNDESADYSHDTASDESADSEEISQLSSSESSSESDEDEMDEFGRALAPISNVANGKPLHVLLLLLLLLLLPRTQRLAERDGHTELRCSQHQHGRQRPATSRHRRRGLVDRRRRLGDAGRRGQRARALPLRVHHTGRRHGQHRSFGWRGQDQRGNSQL